MLVRIPAKKSYTEVKIVTAVVLIAVTIVVKNADIAFQILVKKSATD